MRLISWNVNGLRACLGKGFAEFFTGAQADVFCLQETKMEPHQADLPLAGYHDYWNSAVKKGYSGTAMFLRQAPQAVTPGLGMAEHDQEGRVLCADMGGFYVVTVYTPNAQRGLARLDYRMAWERDFLAWLMGLDARKPVIVCGDLNVAHREIDLRHPKANAGNAGFTPQERERFSRLLDSGFVDTFRHVHGDVTGRYSWWSYMANARANNTGWRLDYFLVSRRLADRVTRADILDQVYGSDHCPVLLEIDLDPAGDGGRALP